MSMENDRPGAGMNSGSLTDEELFMARPIWETRGKKRRGRPAAAPEPTRASTVAAEPRSFASDEREVYGAGASTAEAAAVDPVPPTTGDPALSTPIGRSHSMRTERRTEHRKGSAAPAAIAAGVVALGALAVGGWYATRDNNNGVPELTPGATAPTQTASAASTGALAPTAPAAEPTRTFRATAPMPSGARTAARPTRMASSTPPRARVRPAASAASATTSGVNASTSATLPTGPQPYSSLNPGAPASSTAAAPTPAPVPVTPPTNAAPSETTPPAPPQTQTPTPQETPTPTPQTQT